MKIIKQRAVLEYVTPDALKVIEAAGRVCYKSEDRITPESAEVFCKMLIAPDRGHESVIEHAHARFRFVTDRGVLAELTRHRIASLSVESTRYANYSKAKFGNEITVILPVRYCDDADSNSYRVWLNAMDNAEYSYMRMLSFGAKPQEARDVLPSSLKTEIVMTANLREWRHIFRLRTSPAAHPQMRALAEDALQQIRAAVPILFDNI